MNTISTVELHLAELDGFLNAIRCMLGVAPKLYGAAFIDKNERTLAQIVQEVISDNIYSSTLKINSEFEFKYIQKIFNKYIYSKLKNFERNCLEQLDWNLVEYYGLISTAENESGSWNRLVGQRHTVLEYTDDAGNDGTIFFVEHETFVVMTYLAEAR